MSVYHTKTLVIHLSSGSALATGRLKKKGTPLQACRTPRDRNTCLRCLAMHFIPRRRLHPPIDTRASKHLFHSSQTTHNMVRDASVDEVPRGCLAQERIRRPAGGQASTHEQMSKSSAYQETGPRSASSVSFLSPKSRASQRPEDAPMGFWVGRAGVICPLHFHVDTRSNRPPSATRIVPRGSVPLVLEPGKYEVSEYSR